MKAIKTIKDMRKYALDARKKGKRIGFVPTMGYLHAGHRSLVEAAVKDCDVVVVSIFVNPKQFGPKEDLKKYPRDLARDMKLCREAGADVIFTPSAEEMYPEGYATHVEVGGGVTHTMCGLSRPGHFKGVATVVAKLFNIVGPDASYFGQKDAQQCAVIKRMALDLDLRTEIKVMPTHREKDGLAMSSRNSYLSKAARKEALNIFRSLKRAEEIVKEGIRDAEVVKGAVRSILREGEDTRIDYIQIARYEDLSKIDELEGKIIVAVAVFVGDTRLIDNIVMNVK